MRYELSYWERETFINDIDVAVIGSGLVGLAAAIRLKERDPKLKVVIIERGGMPAGASTRNAGFACFGSMTELLDDMQKMSPDEVWGIVQRRWNGLLRLRTLLSDPAMDYEGRGGYEVFTAADAADYEQCMDNMAAFNRIAADITGHTEVYKSASAEKDKFGFNGVQHLILNQAEGQIHTGKTIQALLALARRHGVEIMNGITIDQIHDAGSHVQMDTAAGWPITAKQVLVCSNGFTRRLFPELEVIPARNQVLVTKPIKNLQVAGCFHYDRGYYYFRNLDGRILLGGGRNLDFEGETTDEFGANERIRTALLELLHTVVCPGQEAEPEIWWTGIMGLGPVKKPIIEALSPRITVAVRLNGMGVAIGSLVGTEGADLVQI